MHLSSLEEVAGRAGKRESLWRGRMRLAWLLRGLVLFSALSVFMLMLEEQDTGRESAKVFQKAFRGRKMKPMLVEVRGVEKEDPAPDLSQLSDARNTLIHQGDMISSLNPGEEAPFTAEDGKGVPSLTLREIEADSSHMDLNQGRNDELRGDLTISFEVEMPEFLQKCSRAVFRLLPTQTRLISPIELSQHDHYLNVQCKGTVPPDAATSMAKSIRFTRRIPFIVDPVGLWYAGPSSEIQRVNRNSAWKLPSSQMSLQSTAK